MDALTHRHRPTTYASGERGKGFTAAAVAHGLKAGRLARSLQDEHASVHTGELQGTETVKLTPTPWVVRTRYEQAPPTRCPTDVSVRMLASCGPHSSCKARRLPARQHVRAIDMAKSGSESNKLRTWTTARGEHIPKRPAMVVELYLGASLMCARWRRKSSCSQLACYERTRAQNRASDGTTYNSRLDPCRQLGCKHNHVQLLRLECGQIALAFAPQMLQ